MEEINLCHAVSTKKMRNFKGFQDFLAKGNYGPSKSNLFEVTIQPPRFVFANTANTFGPG